MDRITRYIIWELASVFAVSVTAMTMLMVFFLLIQEGMRESLTLGTIIDLVPYTIPSALMYAIPGTCLFATCIVYGRMSALNEIVAIKSQGIPPSRVIVPGVVMSFMLSLTTLYLNDLAVSWGRTGVYQVILNASAKTIYSVLGAQGNFSKGKISIIVDDVQGDELHHANIEAAHGSDKIYIQAERARIDVDSQESALVLHVRNARVKLGDSVSFSTPSDSIAIPLGSVTKREGPGRNPSNLPLREMKAELDYQEVYLRQLQQDLAMEAAFDLAGGNTLAITDASWNQKLLDLETETYRKFRLQTEPWRRWANGFSCLCFVIVGAPLAIQMRKNDFFTTFFVCFIPILLAYYPLMMFGVGQAKSGTLPPFIVWLGNLAMIGIGLLLIRRIERR
jgi:lipopolysaccharide export system permease protein